MQLGLPKSKLLARKLEGSLACSTVSSIAILTHQHFLKLYLTTVRPQLEYASSVWDPYLKEDIETIERVQKFGLRQSAQHR